MNHKKKALIIDGNSLIYRFFYASLSQLEYYKANNFEPANALRLMIDACFKLKNNTQYDYGIIAFDSSKKTFRNEAFENYKAGRQKMPDDLVSQLKPTQEILALMGFNVIKMEGVEADDIIGSAAKTLSNNNVECDLYSSDKDLLQLVDQNISVHLLKQGLKVIEDYNINNFQEKFFNLEPKQVIDYKAIVGDSSDNLPGVKGIGAKTGIELIKKYYDLETLYDHLCELTKSQQEKFINSKELAFTCKNLATIKTDIYTNEDIESLMFKNEAKKEIEDFLKKYNFKSLYKYL